MTIYEGDYSDTKDEYATKPDLWRPLADAVGGFDVDPASGVENEAIAETSYTVEDDGLTHSWDGNVWLNPPFSDKMDWYRKAVNELNAGNADVIVALAPVDTSTQWFQNWFSKADLLCWLEGRNWYVAQDSPSFNTVVGVFGEYPDEIIPVLESRGIVTQQIKTSTQQTLTND
jgi:phage N-6-adenine-methyltransferase